MSLDYQDMISSLLLFHNYLKMEDEKVFDDFLKITDNLNSTGIQCSFDHENFTCDISSIHCDESEPSKKRSRISKPNSHSITLSQRKMPLFHIKIDNSVFIYRLNIHINLLLWLFVPLKIVSEIFDSPKICKLFHLFF